MYLAGGTVLWVRLEVTAAAAMALADSVHAERGETERAAENATQRGTEDRDRRGSGACAVLPTAPPAARNDITALENGKDVPCPWRRGAESSAGYWSTRASDRATCDTLSRKTVTQGARRRARRYGAAPPALGAAAAPDPPRHAVGQHTPRYCTPHCVGAFIFGVRPTRITNGYGATGLKRATHITQSNASCREGKRANVNQDVNENEPENEASVTCARWDLGVTFACWTEVGVCCE